MYNASVIRTTVPSFCFSQTKYCFEFISLTPTYPYFSFLKCSTDCSGLSSLLFLHPPFLLSTHTHIPSTSYKTAPSFVPPPTPLFPSRIRILQHPLFLFILSDISVLPSPQSTRYHLLSPPKQIALVPSIFQLAMLELVTILKLHQN